MKKIISLLSILVLIIFIPQIVFAADFMTPQARIFNTDNQHLDMTFSAFDQAFKGGGRVTSGDVNGDGVDEIIIGAGRGGGPQVRIFDHLGKFLGFSIFPFHPDFRGGVDVAAGDVDGDKKDEVIISQLSQGQAWIKVYRADISKKILANFLAYEPGFRGGANVAAGDINGDGKDEIITGSGIGSTSHVRVFDGSGRFLGLALFPYEENYRGGVDVAVGNVDRGSESEIITSKASFGMPQIKVYKTDLSKRILGDFFAFPTSHREGINVASCDIDRDGEDEVVVGSEGYGPHIRTFEAWGYPKTLSFMAYNEDFRGGVDVACGNVDQSSAKEIVTMPGRRIWQGRAGIYKYIEISISKQKLEVYKGGRKINETLISTGTYKYPTPIGDFRIHMKLLSGRMNWTYGPNNPDNYDLPNVPYIMYFNGPYALHGTYWHSNFGHRMSHGCVNLPTPFAAWLYGFSNVGDLVFIRP
jgi:hypothetical protein